MKEDAAFSEDELKDLEEYDEYYKDMKVGKKSGGKKYGRVYKKGGKYRSVKFKKESK